jgi:hypothetical protein
MSAGEYWMFTAALSSYALMGVFIQRLMQSGGESAALRERRRIVMHIRIEADKCAALSHLAWDNKHSQDNEGRMAATLYEIADDVSNGMYEPISRRNVRHANT